MDISLKQLKYFAAVCEAGNISHAASRLNVAQSAISSHIAGLEADLGTALLLRKPRGVEPTAAGQRLHDHARSILRAVETATDDVRSSDDRLAGRINIGMPYSAMRVIGPGVLRRMYEAHPMAKVVLTEALSANTYTQLLHGETDLALIFNPPPDAETDRIPILEEDLICAGVPALLGAADQPIRFADLAELPMALLMSGALARALVDHPGALSRIEPHARYQLASVGATIGVAEAGLACVLAPRIVVAELLDRGCLIARPVIDPTPRRTLSLVSRHGDTPGRLREAVAATILDETRTAVQSGRWPAAALVPG